MIADQASFSGGIADLQVQLLGQTSHSSIADHEPIADEAPKNFMLLYHIIQSLSLLSEQPALVTPSRINRI